MGEQLQPEYVIEELSERVACYQTGILQCPCQKEEIVRRIQQATDANIHENRELRNFQSTMNGGNDVVDTQSSSQMGEQLGREQGIQDLRERVLRYKTSSLERRRHREDTYHSIHQAIDENNRENRQLQIILCNMDRGNENHPFL